MRNRAAWEERRKGVCDKGAKLPRNASIPCLMARCVKESPRASHNEKPQSGFRLISLRMICRAPNCGSALIEVAVFLAKNSLFLDAGDDPARLERRVIDPVRIVHPLFQPPVLKIAESRRHCVMSCSRSVKKLQPMARESPAARVSPARRSADRPLPPEQRGDPDARCRSARALAGAGSCRRGSRRHTR